MALRSKTWQKEWKILRNTYIKIIPKAKSVQELETIRIQALGRKGRLTTLLKTLARLSLEERRILGPLLHGLKNRIEGLLSQRAEDLKAQEIIREIEKTNLDTTLPPSPFPQGHIHPITQTLREMTRILGHLGFAWADGPLVEKDYYNFQALNIPPEHPARDMQDTFYLQSPQGLLMRTHTSPVQIRYMESHTPPIRIMAPGRVFRHEAVDASHSAVFHQIEGLYVDHHVSMADLKGTLHLFLQQIFGNEIQTRFRPSYFPFTEPSAEVDVQCLICKDPTPQNTKSYCSVCKGSGWLEMLGAGMVHPNVFRAVGYDSSLWSGFAFGMAVERMAMFQWGIEDIRMLYENDLRFLKQF